MIYNDLNYFKHFVLKALVDLKIGSIVRKKTGNFKEGDALELPAEIDDRETVRIFQLLNRRSLETEQISFDPYNLFSD